MILCIGEILVDLIGKTNEEGQVSYSRYAGGAPFNVACGIAKYGGQVMFVGNVGYDMHGNYLINYAKNMNFSKTIITQDRVHNTTLAFIENDKFGERSFDFFRKNTADYYFPAASLKDIENADIIHFGSLMLSEDSGRITADKIISLAKQYGKKLSFDINFRDDIFKSHNEAIEVYKHYISCADIIKYSLDELILFTGLSDYQAALEVVAIKDQMVFLTLGQEGSVFYHNSKLVHEASITVIPIDTTGAGDAFYAGILLSIDNNISDFFMNEQIIRKALRFSNVSGALVTTAFGAIDSIPPIEIINSFL